jgi:hypothetical protein
VLFVLFDVSELLPVTEDVDMVSIEWSNPDVMSFSRELVEGKAYKLEVAGMEICCDGPSAMQFKRPNGAWETMSSSTLQLGNPEPLNCDKHKVELLKCPYGKGVNFKSFALESPPSVLPNLDALSATNEQKVDNIDATGKFFVDRNMKENFASSFNAQIIIPKDGQWTFYTNSDDGSRLWVDESLVVDNDGLHSMTFKQGTTFLKRGLHRIRVWMFQRSGEGGIQAWFEGPDQKKVIIPSDSLCLFQPIADVLTCPLGHGVNGKFFKGACRPRLDALGNLNSLHVERNESTDLIDLKTTTTYSDFGECYQAQYISYVMIPTTGNWCFYTVSEDASRLYVDGRQVVDNDGLHGMKRAGGCLHLGRGKHHIQAELQRKKGGAGMSVEYKGPTVEHQIIPHKAMCRIHNW